MVRSLSWTLKKERTTLSLTCVMRTSRNFRFANKQIIFTTLAMFSIHKAMLDCKLQAAQTYLTSVLSAVVLSPLTRKNTKFLFQTGNFSSVLVNRIKGKHLLQHLREPLALRQHCFTSLLVFVPAWCNLLWWLLLPNISAFSGVEVQTET